MKWSLILFPIIGATLAKKDGTCAQHVTEYANALKNQEIWALEMFDATSKLPSGVLLGRIDDLGSFDECLKITAETARGLINGKYCHGKLIFTVGTETKIGWASCFPDSCSAPEITDAFNKILARTDVTVEFQEKHCQVLEDTKPKLTPGAIGTLVFLSGILATILASTGYEIFLSYTQKTKPRAWLLAFSLLTNGKKLFKINHNPSEQLQCLNGLRFISMMWVILCHTFVLFASGPILNYLDVGEWLNSGHSMYIGGGTVSVDTFFLIGGLLMTYGVLKAAAKGIKFNVLLYYQHRYFRLTPALAVVILVTAQLSPYLGNGPNWPNVISTLQEPCKEFWWSSLLYVQNYVNPENMCLTQTWYLSVDTQLFFLSPILLIPLKRWPKPTLATITFLAVAFSAFDFYIAWHYQLNGLLMVADWQKITIYMNNYYFLTHTRVAPWLIGIILGYFIFKRRQSHEPFRVHKIILAILWIASLATLIICVFGGHDTLRGPEYNAWGNAFYISLVRPAWSLGLSWVIIACLFGYGGPINWFLSLPIYQILGRFTYSMYLIHVGLMYLKAQARREPARFNELDLLYNFWGDFAFTFVISGVWILAFESPMIALEKSLMDMMRDKKSKPEITDA